MKHVILVISIFMLGCVSNKPIKTQTPIFPSIDFILDDGTAIKVRYDGMPKQIAQMFMVSINDQKEKYLNHWTIIFHKNSNPSIWHYCNAKECIYSINTYVPCESSLFLNFVATGIYPEIKFIYQSHAESDECCLPIPPRRPWWKIMFD